MADILHSFPVNATVEKVFECISTSKGIDQWWAKSSEGTSAINRTFKFSFGPEHNWSAMVTRFIPNKIFELQMTIADEDWINTKVGFRLDGKNDITQVEFYHKGWPEVNQHYKVSNYCWAMYLRVLKRYAESGEQVPYDERLNV